MLHSTEVLIGSCHQSRWAPAAFKGQRGENRTASLTGSKSTDRGHKGLKAEPQRHQSRPGSAAPPGSCWGVSCFTLWVLQEHCETIKLNYVLNVTRYKWNSRWCWDTIIWKFVDLGLWQIHILHSGLIQSGNPAQMLHKTKVCWKTCQEMTAGALV